MRRNDRRPSKRSTSNKRGTVGLSIRNKIQHNLFKLLKKEQQYFVRKSTEPDEQGDYIVVYESKSKHGYGYGKIYKGSYKDCKEIAEELNKICLERRDLSE